KLLNDNNAQELSEITNGDLKKGVLLTGSSGHAEVYTLFRVPAEMHRFFQNNFASARMVHYYDLWMQEDKKEGVQVVFYPNELLVRIIKNGQLQLLQNFTYQSPEDAAYYLLTLYAQYNFSPEELSLLVSGMIIQDSAIYEELLKYFRAIEPGAVPASLALAPGFEDYPDHFFSPLLKLAVCAL
ncbi:MAG TPA: DUF3822 family protein, partial [Chitinophagaceae bacterium]|nr:DUF3822 family protein [Chitinophagaceae bacterium]